MLKGLPHKRLQYTNFQKTLPRAVSAATRGSLVVISKRLLELTTAHGSQPFMVANYNEQLRTTSGL